MNPEEITFIHGVNPSFQMIVEGPVDAEHSRLRSFIRGGRRNYWVASPAGGVYKVEVASTAAHGWLMRHEVITADPTIIETFPNAIVFRGEGLMVSGANPDETQQIFILDASDPTCFRLRNDDKIALEIDAAEGYRRPVEYRISNGNAGVSFRVERNNGKWRIGHDLWGADGSVIRREAPHNQLKFAAMIAHPCAIAQVSPKLLQTK